MEVAPQTRETLSGLTVEYQAFAKYQTGEVLDVTSSSTWQIQDTSVAELSTPTDTAQPVVAKQAGITKVSAQFNTLVNSAQLVVLDSAV